MSDVDTDTVIKYNVCNDYLQALIKLVDNAPDAKIKADAAGIEWDKLEKPEKKGE
jgi:hypothetical protein